MNRFIKHAATILVGSSILLALSLRATPVTVQEVGVGPSKVVNISASSLGTFNAYAGVLRLVVDGTPTDGFCVDPWHWSSSTAQPYESVDLGSASKPPGLATGSMGTDTALKIEQLWQHYYTPSISEDTAAGLQIAIWKLVDEAVFSATFSINSYDYGASNFIAWVEANPSAPAANLIGLTGVGQDYAIQKVPDGGITVALLGLSFLGLVGLRRKFRQS